MNYDAAIKGLDACVHCGFCLQACPTFVATGDEADSPRGRIVLMQSLRRGELRADDPHLITHIDRCLGCRACETACPSGVDYGQALEATRSRIGKVKPLRADAAVMLAIMAEPLFRRLFFAVAKLFRPLAKFFSGSSIIGFSFGMLAATSPEKNPYRQRNRNARAALTPEPGSPRAAEKAVVFRGCIMDSLFDHVNHATANVLTYNDYAVVPIPAQGCCGALHAHAGLDEQARALARVNIKAFAAVPNALIAINSAGCGSALKEYQHWFAGTSEAEGAKAFSSRVYDVTELLATKGPKRGAPLDVSVAYDAPCHLVHAQRVREEPYGMLHAVPNLRVTPHAGADDCCGSAGIYSMMERAMSREILDRKTQSLSEAAPDFVATGNPGCIMQIGAGLRAVGTDIPVVHPVQILDWSYQKLAANHGRAP